MSPAQLTREKSALDCHGGQSAGVSNLMPGSPSFLSTYAWCSTFGIFLLAAVYLLMALGAPRGLRAHEPTWLLWPCSLVAAVTTGGALFGAFYQVPEPTVSATYSSIGWFPWPWSRPWPSPDAVPAAGIGAKGPNRSC